MTSPRPLKPTYRMQGLAEDGLTPLSNGRRRRRFSVVYAVVVAYLLVVCVAIGAIVYFIATSA